MKASDEFTQIFELRYEAQYSDPHKVSLDAAIERWKFANRTDINPQPEPNLEQCDQIREEWCSRDKVTKLLGMFSSNRLYTDWRVAQPGEALRKFSKWEAIYCNDKRIL